MLQMLLRKKLDPTAEDWTSDGRNVGSRIGSEEDDAHIDDGEDIAIENGDETAGGEKQAKLNRAELRELWSWAGPTENEMARKMLDEETLNDFTFEEQELGVENVVTGIRRKLWESDDEDDEDEEGKMEGIEKPPKTEEKATESPKPVMPMDTIFKYMSTGKLPTTNGAASSQIQRR